MDKLISKYNMLRTEIICDILYLVTFIVLMSPSSSVFQTVISIANLGVSILLLATNVTLLVLKSPKSFYMKASCIYTATVSLICVVLQLFYITVMVLGLVSVFQLISLVLFHAIRTSVSKEERNV